MRRRQITAREVRKGVDALQEVWTSFDRLAVSEAIVRHAGDLAERRALRGFDAIHLASALAQAPEVVMACWDEQLARAARAEGLPVVPESGR